MRRVNRLWAVGLLLMTVCVAKGHAETLAVDDVLSTSAAHSPRILQTLAERDAALGKTLSAQGAFDTQISSRGFGRYSGFWDGQVLDTTVSQDLRQFGITLFGGYRISDNRFPIYEDQYFTNSGGEFKAGFVLSLLRDRAFDAERAGLVEAAQVLDAAELEMLLARIDVQRRATVAYHRWVAAGLQLDVYEDLLSIAQDRDRALERRVREGRVARVLVTDNFQNVLRRRALVVEARRQLAVEAQALSLYYRDDTGLPMVPEAPQLPRTFPPVGDLPPLAPQETLTRAQSLRPELALIETNLALAENRMRLARNDLKPQLDLEYYVARDFGAVAEGGPSREGTDNVVAVVFKVPLQQRDARGRIAAEKATMRALDHQRQYREEQIAVEVRTLHLDLAATREMVALALDEQQQAEIMQDLERRRFEGGVSDFFLLNEREERAANAKIRRVAAQLRYFVTRADFNAAVVNLSALGLDD